MQNKEQKILLAALELLKSSLAVHSPAFSTSRIIQGENGLGVGSAESLTVDDVVLLAEKIKQQEAPKVLIVVSNGIADYWAVDAQVVVFDIDVYDINPGGFIGAIPGDFKLLALQALNPGLVDRVVAKDDEIKPVPVSTIEKALARHPPFLSMTDEFATIPLSWESASMFKSMFKAGQVVTHVEHQNNYRITAIPDKDVLLEYCGEPFYDYEDIGSGQRWVRRQSEMEDGRFVGL